MVLYRRLYRQASRCVSPVHCTAKPTGEDIPAALARYMALNMHATSLEQRCNRRLPYATGFNGKCTTRAWLEVRPAEVDSRRRQFDADGHGAAPVTWLPPAHRCAPIPCNQTGRRRLGAYMLMCEQASGRYPGEQTPPSRSVKRPSNLAPGTTER